MANEKSEKAREKLLKKFQVGTAGDNPGGYEPIVYPPEPPPDPDETEDDAGTGSRP